MANETYADSYTPEHFERRRQEAAEELKRIERALGKELNPNRILEIGAGIGGVTAALRDLFPESSILSLDQDEAVLAGYADKFADALLVGEAIEALTNEPSLIDSADLVIALRISAIAALEIIRTLVDLNYEGIGIVSFINESEGTREAEEAIRQLNDLVSLSHLLTVVPLKEGRGHNERAYVLA